MSMNNLTIDGEFRYIVQWFNEWSELQRDDFIPILAKYITGFHINDDISNEIHTTVPVNMNGISNDLEFNGRPMSLFQCRIKLFNQWNQRWPIEFKDKLLQKITEIDNKVGEKIKLSLNPNNLVTFTNGYASNEQNQQGMQQLKANIDIYASEVDQMVSNNPVSEVLYNETSVDDIERNVHINNIIEQHLLNRDDNDVVSDGDGNNDNNTRSNQAVNNYGEPVEQVIQVQNLKINEEVAEEEKDHEDVTATTEQKQQQQPIPSVTVTVNPVVVTQTITVKTDVPLVV